MRQRRQGEALVLVIALVSTVEVLMMLCNPAGAMQCIAVSYYVPVVEKRQTPAIFCRMSSRSCCMSSWAFSKDSNREFIDSKMEFTDSKRGFTDSKREFADSKREFKFEGGSWSTSLVSAAFVSRSFEAMTDSRSRCWAESNVAW